MTMLTTDSAEYTVNRGTYSLTPVVVVSLGGNFVEDVEVTTSSSAVSLFPASMSAALGDGATGAFLGAAIGS